MIQKDDLRDLAVFFMHPGKVLAEFGLGFKGLSVRQYQDGWRLAVKVVEHGLPLVGFCTGQTTTGSVCKFLNLLGEGHVKWQTDRYP